MPGRFDVVKIEDGTAASCADLLPVGGAPEMLDHSQVVGRAVLEKAGNILAEPGEAVDQRRTAPQQALAIAERAHGVVFGVSGKIDCQKPVDAPGWKGDFRARRTKHNGVNSAGAS